MPEDQNIIFKLQLDASGYITGINTAADATARKFVDAQRKANDALIDAKKRLADVTVEIESLKQGIKSSEAEGQIEFADKLREDLEVAKIKQADLNSEVAVLAKAYTDANTAATNFFSTQAKAQTLVRSGAQVVPQASQLALPFQQPGAQLSLFDQIPQGVNDTVDQTVEIFQQLRDAIAAVDEQLQGLDKTSEEFQQVSAFKEYASSLLNLRDSLKLIGDSSEGARQALTAYRDELQKQTEAIRTYIQTLDKTSAAYRAFSGLLTQNDAVLKIYNASLEKTGTTLDQTGEKHLSLRTRISQLRTEMSVLSETGQEETEKFQELQIEAAKLTHEYQLQQQRIRILASEHKALDFGKAAIKGAIGGFETLASVQVLFGEKQEELEKITLKLFAAMQLLNGLQELEEATNKNGTLAVLGRHAANIAATASTKVFAAAVGTATGAAKALRVALLSTGILAVVAGIGVLIAKFVEWRKRQEEALRAEKTLQEINEKAVEGYAKEVSQLDLLTKELADHTVTQEKRIELAREYNKTAEAQNQIDLKQIDNTDNVTAAINRQIAVLRQRATVEAGRAVTQAAATKEFQNQVKVQSLIDSKKFQSLNLGIKVDLQGNIDEQLNELKKKITDVTSGVTLSRKDLIKASEIKELIDDLEELKKAQDEYNTTLGITAKLSNDALKGQVQPLHDQLHTIGEIRAYDEKEIKHFQDLIAALDPADKALKAYYESVIRIRQAEIQSFDPQGIKDYASEVAAQLQNIQQERFNAAQIRLQSQISEDEAIISDEKISYNKRFAATQDFYNKSLKLITESASFEVQQSRAATERTRAELNKRLQDPTAILSPQQKADINTQLSRLSLQEANREIAIEAKKNADILALNRTSEKQRFDLYKSRTDLIRKVDQEVIAFEQNVADQSVATIRDEFERRAAAIDQGEKKELENAQRAQAERLRQLDIEKPLLGVKKYYEELDRITKAGEDQVTNIVKLANQQRQDLAADTFQRTLQAYDKAINGADAIRGADETKEIQAQAQRFQSGKITFEKFQREIADIQRKYNAQRRAGNLQVLDDEISAIKTRLETEKNLSEQEIKSLQDQLTQLQIKRNDQAQQDAIQNAQDKQIITQQRLSDIDAYTQAVANMATAVIGFWQAANDAEQKSLDRSIALQERRVAEAQRIADRGNAAYLKSETDRLKQLEVERENSARRQLGIDAALQASQILVGITGAIAKISTGVGAAETIADIAVIVGALATGYGLIKSLQANQPRLKEGTPYLERGTHPVGTDTIPAWLNAGEAVIPTETNARYKPVIEAVYYEKIPADVMNSFVKGYKEKISEKQYDKLDSRAKVAYTMLNVTKKFLGEKHDEKVIRKMKFTEVNKYMEAVNTSINKRKDITNIHDVMKDIVFDAHRVISPFNMEKVRDTTYEKHLMNFIDTFHELKPIPQPNYDHIAEVNSIQLGHDGKLRTVIEQQNELLKKNNEHHKETQKILKAMGVSLKIDHNGVAAIAMDAINQKKIDAKL